MGCGSSIQKADESKKTLEAQHESLSNLCKTYCGKPDLLLFGSDTDAHSKIVMQPAFCRSEGGAIYLLSLVMEEKPSTYPASPSTSILNGKRGNTNIRNAEEEEELEGGATTAAAGQHENGEQEQNRHNQETEAPAAQEKPVPCVRWALYNDTRSDAEVTITFFRAKNIRVLSKTIKSEDLGGDKLRIHFKLAPTRTIPVIEGEASGYLWKCQMRNMKGTFAPMQAMNLKRDAQ